MENITVYQRMILKRRFGGDLKGASCCEHGDGLGYQARGARLGQCVWSLWQGSERERGQRLSWAGVLDNQNRWRGSLGNMDLRWSGIFCKRVPGDRHQSNIEVAVGLYGDGLLRACFRNLVSRVTTAITHHCFCGLRVCAD